MKSHDRYRADFLRHFGFLMEECGFELIRYGEEPRAFNNFGATLSRDGLFVRIIRDRGQVFVELSPDGVTWHPKDPLLEQLGIPWDRHPTIAGLWDGYEIEHQGRELREYLSLLMSLVRPR